MDIELRPKGSGGVSSYKFSFSPSRGFLAIRQETVVASPNGEPYVATSEVLDFWEIEPGLAVPKTIRTTSTHRPGTTYLTDLKGAVINRPIEAREFALEFPEGIGVVDERGRDRKYHLWGKGFPAHTFESAEDYLGWSQGWKPAWYFKARGRAQLPAMILVVGTLSAGSVLAVIAHRRRARRGLARVG